MDRATLLDRVMHNYRRFYMRKALFHYPVARHRFRRRYLLGCLKAFAKAGFQRTFYDLGKARLLGPAIEGEGRLQLRPHAHHRQGADGRLEMLMADAGVRTGRYILENRIPRPVRRLLQNLPVWLAARALLKAIRAHAWTFAGNARVSIAPGHPAIIEIRSNPIAVPGCPWHRGVFEMLFSGILGKPVHVDHSTLFDGQSCDRFMVRWNV
jgi:hypothetical protein